jgi:hypothetical protein
MANTIRIKRSSTAGVVPTAAQLANGELSLNIPDGKLYYKDGSTVKCIADKKFNSADMNYTSMFLNGNFNIWQRGTTLSNPANQAYLSDMWKITYNADGGTLPSTITHSRQNLTAGDILKSYYHYRIAPNGTGSGFGANSYYQLMNYMENATRYYAGLNKKVYVRFYAKSSIAGKRLGIYMLQNYGTGTNSPSSEEVINGANFTLTTTWTLYTASFSLNTIAGKTFGNNENDALILCMPVQWNTGRMAYVGSATSELFGNGNIDIAQAQVTPYETDMFQTIPFNNELMLCKRYFEKSYNYNITPGTIAYEGSMNTRASNNINASTSGYLYDIPVPYQIEKRSTPTVTLYARHVANTPNAITVRTNVLRSGCTANYPSSSYLFYRIAVDNTSASSINSGNQVEFQWTADASY